jgi:hypothetical protein
MQNCKTDYTNITFFIQVFEIGKKIWKYLHFLAFCIFGKSNNNGRYFMIILQNIFSRASIENIRDNIPYGQVIVLTIRDKTDTIYRSWERYISIINT